MRPQLVGKVLQIPGIRATFPNSVIVNSLDPPLSFIELASRFIVYSFEQYTITRLVFTKTRLILEVWIPSKTLSRITKTRVIISVILRSGKLTEDPG